MRRGSLAAADARSDDLVFKRPFGGGRGFNSNYAALSLGPDGSAYIDTLGGLVRVTDTG